MKKLVLLVTALLVSAPAVFSQVPPVPLITLGNSAVALDGDWKFQPGDSPWVNGAPLWSQPGFDDSHWASMNLKAKEGATDILIGTSGFVPGWTSRGYPQLTGYAWYRLRVRVVDTGEPLWLKMPPDFDDAFQLYANGSYIGQYGRFEQKQVLAYYAHPVFFLLPKLAADGEMDLALRFYLSAATAFQNPDVGGLHGPPVLGLASSVRLMQAAENGALQRRYFSFLLEGGIGLLFAPLALWAWLRNRQAWLYLWLFLYLASLASNGIEALVTIFSSLITIRSDVLYLSISRFSLLLPILFWKEWFGLKNRWLVPAAVGLVAARAATHFAVDSPLLGVTFLPPASLHVFDISYYWVGAGIAALLLTILALGYRRNRTEALLATIPILLFCLDFSELYFTTRFRIPLFFRVFGLGIETATIIRVLNLLVIGVLVLRRFVSSEVSRQLERDTIAQDLEQARQLQQRVLVPEVIESPVFRVETEYRPAQTIGGDFFQTITGADGTLLVVIGDVSGKGVSAAMLVAVLVGAIRTQADHSFDPSAMLALLNHRLMGRSGGHFATCLVARILPDGLLRIASAGHLPPYRNGEELDLEGSLPLGLDAAASYAVTEWQLDPGDRLTFLTDGVVEAADAAGDLYGFERARSLSEQAPATIAEEAQRFGQRDDITAIAVSFTGVTAPA